MSPLRAAHPGALHTDEREMAVMEYEIDERGIEYVEDADLATLPDGWAMCGACGTAWNDAKSTAWTPAPSGRCPFEYDHEDEDEDETERAPGPAALAGEIPALTPENANVQRYVSLVRVGNEWHAFSDVRRAWRFYETWKPFRDCEYVGDVPIDVDIVD